MYIGIDIGGTNTRIGLFETPQKIVNQSTIETNPNYDQGLETIVTEITNLLGDNQLEGIGIGIAGRFDDQKNKIIAAPNLHGWIGNSLAKNLSERVKTTVKAENDASVAAIAEALTGEAKGEKSFIFMVWGTGIGGKSIVRIGEKIKVHEMEPGHQIIEWDGKQCGCRQKGCLETFCGGGFLEQKYGDLSKLTDEIWDEVAGYMAHGLINTLHHFPVKLVVFGGGLITRQSHLLEKIHAYLVANGKDYYIPKLVLSKHGELGGMIGAASLFFVDIID